MNFKALIFTVMIFFNSPLSATVNDIRSLSPKGFTSQLETYIENEDFLKARILVRNYPVDQLNYKNWVRFRASFHRNYHIGWDLLLYWDQRPPKKVHRSMRVIYRMLKVADRFFEKKEFLQAARVYQKITRLVKKYENDSNLNQTFYFSVLHSLARSLYGAGRYSESLKVYTWMSPIYPRFKQTLVEKMWAAFRAKDLSLTTGAIASQYSSYFEGFIHPETYLVQIYLFKLLCREEDLNLTLRKMRKFRSELMQGRVTLIDWARSSFETLPYVKLIKEKDSKPDELMSRNMLEKEKKTIQIWMKSQFKNEVRQFLYQSGKIEAYAKITQSTTDSEMPPVKDLPSQEEILRSGQELWPVDDAEDWLDEVGLHRFIGKSRCTENL